MLALTKERKVRILAGVVVVVVVVTRERVRERREKTLKGEDLLTAFVGLKAGREHEILKDTKEHWKNTGDIRI